MIRRKGNLIKMDTPHTSLVLKAEGDGAELLYYGKTVRFGPDFSLLSGEDKRLLFSSYGSVDFRESGLVVLLSDGSAATRFSFVRVRRMEKPSALPLPASYGEADTVCLEFADEYAKLRLYLYYSVFSDCDAIAVNVQLTNAGKKPVRIRKISSLQLDLIGEGYSLVTFDGSWGAERTRHETPVNGTLVCNESRTGSSSPFHNPFVMLERKGEVYGFNLVYSGNHRETAEGNNRRQLRFLSGIGGLFEWTLEAGETFTAPEAVMTFGENRDEVTSSMQTFAAEHIVRGRWQKRVRPVLVNNWEGTYFAFDRERILTIAKASAEAGAELFVLDDGWFGHRDDDTSSLGDWTDYAEKTGGLASLADEIRALGLKFGIWMEPEMISEDSELYAKHPEFAMRPMRREPARMRNQLMLNLADKQVQNYVVRAVSNIIVSTKAAYVKWDYNRHITDPYGKGVAAGEYAHRYILGLYAVLQRLTEKFPLVLFESCASGGGRFDPGMLAFMPQTWTSDNTDARERLTIQEGTAYAYPTISMGAHVSASPNHQSGNRTPLETRFNVACGGVLGYEMDISRLNDREKEIVKAQIAYYKKYRELFQFGRYYRLEEKDGTGGFVFVSADQTKAIAVVTAKEKVTGQANARYRLKGLNPQYDYIVKPREQSNYASCEEFTAAGDMLMQGGVPTDLFCDTENDTNSVYARMLFLRRAPARR